MTALTRFVLRHKALVVLFWLAVTAAGIMTDGRAVRPAQLVAAGAAGPGAPGKGRPGQARAAGGSCWGGGPRARCRTP